MGRIVRAGVIVLMAAVAILRPHREVAVVASVAVAYCQVSASQRGGVCERRSAPVGRGDGMATTAIRSDRGCTVRGIRRGVVGVPVTTNAIDRDIYIFMLLLVRMARLAGEGSVRSHQGKSRAVVPLGHIGDEPGLRRVAAIAGVAQLGAVNVRMAIRAHCLCRIKHQRRMALRALYLCVLSLQREAGFGMIEFRHAGKVFPGRWRMARLTREREFFAVRRFLCEGEAASAQDEDGEKDDSRSEAAEPPRLITSSRACTRVQRESYS
jgi:hypothetical protein